MVTLRRRRRVHDSTDLQARHFFASLLVAAMGMALYIRAP
jgi:hypothetical protein